MNAGERHAAKGRRHQVLGGRRVALVSEQPRQDQPLARDVAPREVLARIGLGVAAVHRLAHRLGERPPFGDGRQHVAERPADAPLDPEHAVAALDELAVRVEDRQAGARPSPRTGCGVPWPRPSREGAAWLSADPASGFLLARTRSKPVAERRAQQVPRLLGGHVHEHRARDRVARDVGEGRRRGRRPSRPRDLRSSPASLPFARRKRRRAREPLRVEDVPRAVEEADDADAAPSRSCAPSWSARARPTRPKPRSTTSLRGRLVGAAAADLGELEGVVDPARRLRRRPWP